MKTTRHTINVPAEMGQLLNDRIADFRSLSAYFVALCFADLLYLPKRPIAKAFANASWQQQRRAIESLVTLRKQGWKGVNLKVHFDVVTQVEKVAQKCLNRTTGSSTIFRKNSLSCGARICGDSGSCAAHHCVAQYIPELRGAAHHHAAQCMPDCYCRLGLIIRYRSLPNPRSENDTTYLPQPIHPTTLQDLSPN